MCTLEVLLRYTASSAMAEASRGIMPCYFASVLQLKAKLEANYWSLMGRAS